MVHAIRIHQAGGPEVMKWESVEVGEPGPGQVRLKQHAIGVNYIDTYHRSGLYKLPLPAIIGSEGAGEVTAVGSGVTDFKVGDRGAYAGASGGYAQERLLPADRLVKLPASVDYKTAAAMMLQGMTVRYLLRETYKVTKGTTLLLHAAAGGIGLIASQWAKHLGATTIGTVGSAEKGELAKAHGCNHVINYKSEDFVKRVKVTNGQGVDVVYDSIGKDTFPGSLDCLKPLGLWISFGAASGPVPPFEVSALQSRGSLYATRPTLQTYVAKRQDLLANASELFDVVGKGIVKINVNHTYALKDAAQAHKDLEGRNDRLDRSAAIEDDIVRMEPRMPQRPIELHYWPTPNGHKITIMLEECGLPYTIKPVNIGRGEQFKPEFLAISPNNRMPAIVDPDGPGGQAISVFESGAILQYLGRKTGMFYPSEERARVEVEQWLFWQMGGLGPMAGQAHHFRNYAPEKIAYGIDRYTNEVHRLYGVLNTRLADRPYLAGEYSIADMASYPWVRPYKNQGQDIAEFPNLEAWYQRMHDRPAVAKAVKIGEELRANYNLATDKEAQKVLFGQRARK